MGPIHLLEKVLIYVTNMKRVQFKSVEDSKVKVSDLSLKKNHRDKEKNIDDSNVTLNDNEITEIEEYWLEEDVDKKHFDKNEDANFETTTKTKNKLQAHPEVREGPEKMLHALLKCEKFKDFFVDNKNKTEEQLLDIIRKGGLVPYMSEGDVVKKDQKNVCDSELPVEQSKYNTKHCNCIESYHSAPSIA